MTPSSTNTYSKNDQRNIELAYTYTQEFISDRKTEIRQLEWRLGTFLGFSGLLLRFAIDLPSNCPSYLYSKIGVILASSCAAGIAAWGLRSVPKGKFVLPSRLMEDERFNSDNLEVKARIINTHNPSAKNLDAYALQKHTILNQSILLLSVAIALFALNGILVSLFGQCN